MGFFGLSPKRAAEAANKQALPVPAYRLGSNKSPWFMQAGCIHKPEEGSGRAGMKSCEVLTRGPHALAPPKTMTALRPVPAGRLAQAPREAGMSTESAFFAQVLTVAIFTQQQHENTIDI